MKFVLFLIFVFAALPAWACFGPEMEVETFLKSLPPTAREKPLVAEVEILETRIVDDQNLARLSQVRVIDAVQGTDKNATFTVMSQTHDCAADFNVQAGETYFIAGALNAQGIFEGSWQGEATRLKAMMEKMSKEKSESNH